MKTPLRKKEEIEIQTSSMADIVFLLLIFFIVSTSMDPAKGVGMTLPPPGEEVKLDQKNILSIYVNKEGGVLIREDVVELDDIRERVEEEIRKNDKLVISLTTDKQAQYGMMIEVLDQLKLADAKKISLATPDF